MINNKKYFRHRVVQFVFLGGFRIYSNLNVKIKNRKFNQLVGKGKNIKKGQFGREKRGNDESITIM
jgi:hypothetical protein